MKTNYAIPFSAEDQLDNIDEMLIQYIETTFDLLEKIMDIVEMRKELINQIPH